MTLIKEYAVAWLWFHFSIYSEQRNEHLYKHFLKIRISDYNILSVTWRTGSDSDNVRNYSHFVVRWFGFKTEVVGVVIERDNLNNREQGDNE